MNSKFFLSLLFLMGLVALAACTPTPTQSDSTSANLPNPASVYCQQNDGTLEIRTDASGGQYGICEFADGSECDEWAFYRGECKLGDSLITPEPENPDSNTVPTEEIAADGCKVYRDGDLGYSFHYPADASIVENDDPTNSYSILGPMVDDNNWPMIYIAHPQDRDEYRLPEGADLVTWLTDHNMLAEERKEDVQIAGTTAVHIRFETQSGQSYNYDHYFFAHSGQLYSITILHTGNKEDWDLYNHFLDSFQFDQ